MVWGLGGPPLRRSSRWFCVGPVSPFIPFRILIFSSDRIAVGLGRGGAVLSHFRCGSLLLRSSAVIGSGVQTGKRVRHLFRSGAGCLQIYSKFSFKSSIVSKHMGELCRDASRIRPFRWPVGAPSSMTTYHHLPSVWSMMRSQICSAGSGVRKSHSVAVVSPKPLLSKTFSVYIPLPFDV